MKKNTKILIFFSAFVFVVFCLITTNSTVSAESFELRVPIGDLKSFEVVKCESGKQCSTNYISKYINALVTYGLRIASILSALIVMISGFIWLTAGTNASREQSAKQWFAGAISGLTLAMCSYLILVTINPTLVDLDKPVSLLTLDDASIIGGDSFSHNLMLSGVAYQFDPNQSGRQLYSQCFPSSLRSQIKTYMRDVQFASGGDSSTCIETRATVTDQNAIIARTEGDIRATVMSMNGNYSYNQTLRGGTLNDKNYIDCSYFAGLVLNYSGFNLPRSMWTTRSMFTANQATRGTIDNLDNLPAGTLVGYPGHVWVSLGGGAYAEAHGGNLARTSNQTIRIIESNNRSGMENTLRKRAEGKPYILQVPRSTE